MRIIAMLSYYNEDPELLRESVHRVCSLGIDALTVVDGAYDLYPAKRRYSGPGSLDGIIEGLRPGVRFDRFNKDDWGAGNEVEKRNFMLERALEIAEEGDWLLVFDSDHMWETVGFNSSITLKDVFRRSEVFPPYENLVAEVSFADCAIDEIDPSWYEACLLYRAVPGMRYEGAHWRIRFPDGTVSTTLRTEQEKHTAPTIDLRDSFRVRHTVYQAGEERRTRQTSWYEQRDGLGLEK